MSEFNEWWKRRSKTEAIVYTVACLALILVLGIDIGRALFEVAN